MLRAYKLVSMFPPLLDESIRGIELALGQAIAMLIEHRLPHAALAGGDFSPEQAKEARTRLEAILGESLVPADAR